MKFLDVLKRKKFIFLNIFLFLYIAINLFTGERGLISYFEKKELEMKLSEKKILLKNEISDTEHKNLLLSENLNFDFVDILIREKLKFGKKNEILIKLNE
tara:strand:+ start:348 stop:647 length:300 start_codon:yes stop_codon:yes gene_type:complete